MKIGVQKYGELICKKQNREKKREKAEELSEWADSDSEIHKYTRNKK